MAIWLEYCNVIVPVKSIREKLGSDIFKDKFDIIMDIMWHDGHLFREGCMNHSDLQDILDYWKSQSFELLTLVNGQKHWKDVCVVNSGYGPSYPCDWIEYDRDRNIVWLKGQEPGTVVGPPRQG